MIKRTVAVFVVLVIAYQAAWSVSAAEISVSAESAVIMCAEDNSIIYEKNSKARLPMASTTKIMTCLVALERGELSGVVQVAPEAVGVEGSSLYLQEGDSLTLEALLYALMLRSANDCAAAVAFHIAGSIEAFAEMMNEKAAELGMADTHFTNPHGLYDEEHYTTAYDFALLASYAMKNEQFAKIVSTVSYTVELNGGECHKAVANHNKLLRIYDGALGIKTGFTKASGRCLVSAAKRDGVMLVAVTLSAPDDWNDHIKMLDLGFSEYERAAYYAEGELFYDFDVAGAGSVRCANRDEISVIAKKGSEVTYRVLADHLIFAPVAEGDIIATVQISVDGRVVREVPLYALDSAEAPRELSFIEKIGSLF